MRLRELTLKDKKLFERFLHTRKHELSAYSFVNIYIWKKIFDVRWALIDEHLCLFFKDRIGSFLYIPPQSLRIRPGVIEEVFKIMDAANKNKDISRLENAEAKDIAFYQRLGYRCQEKFPEYLCRRADLVGLKGNRFKSKRACVNYFTKHYKFEYLPFSLKQRDDCLRLYDNWMHARQIKSCDPVYKGMLGESKICLKVVLNDYAHLGIAARIVVIENRVRGFTCGFRLSKDIFCILYEIADLSVKGLAQFIFREFCRELKGYRYINIMDDSGLENLKKVKLSYHPARLIPSYIVKRSV